MLRDVSPRNTPVRRSEWGSSLPPDCFVSRMCVFLNINVLQGAVVSTSPNPQAGGPPLVGCPRLIIQFIRSYPPYRRQSLYPQSEDTPCRGDRDPLYGCGHAMRTKYVWTRGFLLDGRKVILAVTTTVIQAVYGKPSQYRLLQTPICSTCTMNDRSIKTERQYNGRPYFIYKAIGPMGVLRRWHSWRNWS